MILRGCCSSVSVFGFFMLGSLLRLPLHRTREKGRKDCPTAANIPVKGGRIEVNADATESPCGTASIRSKGNNMGRAGKKTEKPKRDDGKSSKSPPAPIEDEDIEDGDIATPKRDRYGDDDQPL